MNFNNLNIKPSILEGISSMEFTTMTEIQEKVIPIALNNVDIIGQAPTGTGKTIAFTVPLLNVIDEKSKKIQALVIAPTRELAVQITNEINLCAQHMNKVVAVSLYGGEFIEKQISALRKNPQIIVVTPGRLMDHMNRGNVYLNDLKIVVLDEADEMFNMGFRDDIASILDNCQYEHQTMLFSATFNKEVEDLARKYMKDPQKILVNQGSLTVSLIEQKYVLCNESDKVEIMSRLIEINEYKLVMVFCNTKRGVDEVTSQLLTRGFLAEALHGDMKQMQRDRVMMRFREGTINILVASDVAARGLDIDDVDAVFNYDLPYDDEYYVHRIGRTGRALKTGVSISLVTKKERNRLNYISKYIKKEIEVIPIPSLEKVIKVRCNRLLERAIKVSSDFEETTTFEENKFVSIIEKQIRRYDDVSKDQLIKGLLNIIINAESTNREIQEVSLEIEERKNSRTKSKDIARMFITLGRKDNIKVYTITDLLVKSTNLTNKDINNVLICDSFSFFEIPRKHIVDVLHLSNELRFNNRRIGIEEAKGESKGVSKREKPYSNKNFKRNRKK